MKATRVAVLGTAVVAAATLLTACAEDDHECDAALAVTSAPQTNTSTGEHVMPVAAPGRSTGGTGGGRAPAPRPASTGGHGGAHVDIDDDCD